MYREAPKKGPVCFCPVCHQFGRPVPGATVEGKTKSGVLKRVCSQCGKLPNKKVTKYLPGQGVLSF